MKRYISLFALTTGLTYGAATSMSPCSECTARKAAQLPLQVERVLLGLAIPGVDNLKGQSIEIERCSDLGVERSTVLALETSLGICYERLISNGFNTTLTHNKKVVKRGNIFFVEALKECPPELLLKANMFDEELMGCTPDAQPERDQAQIEAHLRTYVSTFGKNLVKIMNSKLEQPLKLEATIENVIRDNAEKVLSQKDLITYMAGQLATAFSLRLQLKQNPAVFEKKFAHILEIAKIVDALNAPDTESAEHRELD